MQVIKIQPTKFLINNKFYDFIKPNFLMQKFGILIKAKVKGSTLGWHIEGTWISYNDLKKAKK
jgi:hypothetical protein